jgi:cation diffusion facilitator family transporter
LILLATGVGVVYDACKNYLNPGQIKLDYLVFVVMAFSDLVNFATSKIKIYYGKKENSLTLLSDGSHDKADVLASAAVLLGLFLTRYWIHADSLLAFLIGLYIIKESFSLGKEAIDSLLDVSAGEEIEAKIRAIVQKEKVEIDSLKTQKKGSVVTANLEIKLPSGLKVEEATKISEELKRKLIEGIENLSYIAIQIKSYDLSAGYFKPEFGKGFGWQRKGRFKEGDEKSQGEGPGGNCVCPKCGHSTSHERGVPCSELKCPSCNINLERK